MNLRGRAIWSQNLGRFSSWGFLLNIDKISELTSILIEKNFQISWWLLQGSYSPGSEKMSDLSVMATFECMATGLSTVPVKALEPTFALF